MALTEYRHKLGCKIGRGAEKLLDGPSYSFPSCPRFQSSLELLTLPLPYTSLPFLPPPALQTAPSVIIPVGTLRGVD